MKTVIMSIGVPGVGKTTRMKKLAIENGYTYVCPDDIREAELGDYRDQSQNDRIWQMAFDQIKAALDNGQSVLVDGAAITRYHRIPDIKKYRSWGADKVIGYWFQAPHEVALERNDSRGEKKIPDEVIIKLYHQLEGAERPKLEDGFDELEVIQTS